MYSTHSSIVLSRYHALHPPPAKVGYGYSYRRPAILDKIRVPPALIHGPNDYNTTNFLITTIIVILPHLVISPNNSLLFLPALPPIQPTDFISDRFHLPSSLHHISIPLLHPFSTTSPPPPSGPVFRDVVVVHPTSLPIVPRRGDVLNSAEVYKR